MRIRRLTEAIALAGGLLLAGCDGQMPEKATPRVSMDVSPLFRPAGAAAHCVSVAEELVLTVTGEGGGEDDYRRPLTLEEEIITFEVEVAPGEADFAAGVWSNNGTLLYAGQVTAEVEDGFAVTVPLTKRAAVLQVCPATLTLGVDRNGAFGEFIVYNRGNNLLAWQALPPALLCDGEPCLSFDGNAGVVAAGGSETVFVAAPPGFAGNTTMQVASPVGSVVLDVQVQ